MARYELARQLRLVRTTYAGYRAIPDEVDARKVSGSTGRAFERLLSSG